MTREEAIRQLKTAAENRDTKAAHLQADFILCELLSALGYRDVVAAWDEVDKRYA